MADHSRRNLGALVAGVLVAVALVFGSVLLIVKAGQTNSTASAQSTLANCQQIETVKTALRATFTESLAKTARIAYYQTHPAELATAQAITQQAIVRFRALNCYDLASVKNAGLRPPRTHKSHAP